MADLDLDAIAARELVSHHGEYPHVELGFHERDALVAAVRWAQDAPHRSHCAVFNPSLDADDDPRPCTCGRDEALRPFGGDRG